MFQRAIQLVGGSTIGRDHRLAGKNNQDAFTIQDFPLCSVGIVADGCGSKPHSDVGAKLGVKLLGKSINTEVENRDGSSAISWRRVRQHLLSNLDVLACGMGGNYRRTVEEYFLFTLVGVLLTRQEATFFAFGDGYMTVNGESYPLGPFPGNEPPYVGYGLLPDNVGPELASCQFQVIQQLPLGELKSFVLGSDGVHDLEKAANKLLPGETELTAGSPEQFQDEHYFGDNSILVSRRLGLIARDWPRRQPKPGLLRDDTTLIAGRRQPVPEPIDEAAQPC